MLVDFIFNIPNYILATIVCKSKASKKIKKKKKPVKMISKSIVLKEVQ